MTTKQLLQNLQGEREGAYLYHALADLEKDAKLKELYHRMAIVEEKHGKRWEAQLMSNNTALPSFSPSFRTRTLVWLAKRFGVNFVLPTIASAEARDRNKYTSQVAADVASDEQRHSLLLQQLIKTSPKGIGGSEVAKIEGRHNTGGNALRAAVLGANDGLVSNLSLVMGVAGAAADNTTLLITGFAGLLAGACSMALGEWLSVQSSRELYEKQIKIEKEELAASPEEEVEELSLIYQSRGLDEASANELAKQLLSSPESAIETLAREELGVNPEELGGSAWQAAFTSFILFAIGAIIPVLPFLFFSGNTVLISLAFSAAGLFGIGASITLFTGRSVLFSGFRQVIFGLIAAAITYGVGKLIGVDIQG